MRVLLYRGRSIVSRGIQLQTRSKYSHVAVELDNGAVIEAWHKGGVRLIKDPFEGHSDKTLIDVYRIDEGYKPHRVERFLRSRIGRKYDFRSVFRFLTRIKAKDNDKWFCSELTIEAFRHGGLNLLKGNSGMLSPRDVSLSPNLTYIHTLEKKDGRIVQTEG